MRLVLAVRRIPRFPREGGALLHRHAGDIRACVGVKAVREVKNRYLICQTRQRKVQLAYWLFPFVLTARVAL